MDDHAAQELLPAAQRGDHRAFAQLIEPYRGELHAHCYRMSGSVHDADDVMSDVLLRAWSGLPGFAGRTSVRRWLFQIATNACLTMIARRGNRVLPVDLSAPADPGSVLASARSDVHWLQPYPDAVDERPDRRVERRADVELAFVAALQHLPGNERAALLLREVIGFSAREVAELMDTTAAGVNSALQRARRIVGERRPVVSDHADTQPVVDNYVRAFEAGDVDAMVSLLTDDVTWSMPPTPTWFQGVSAVTAFLTDYPMQVRWRHLVTSANGAPAVACYRWDADSGAFLATVVDVLTLRAGRICAVTAFINPELFARFGLPAVLPAT